ncbi:MAG: sugar ABC transporter ATP-binding protein [Armatimonadetes bacterium]|nr:sugar ABC transporter ATP-binding protein [Armatimonadota bacterium]
MAQTVTPSISEIALAVRGLRKRFGGVEALRGVDVTVRAGECHGLVGANGAGKSTLAKILAGVLRPDAGEIELFGRRMALPSPHAAEAAGIGLVPQEPMLCPNLSVAENLALGRERTTFWGTLRRRHEEAAARDLLSRVGLSHLDPATPVEVLNVADRQLVEVARALGADARLLILDEPTSAITAAEAENLFSLMRSLQERGVTLIYVSHRLAEVFALCDTITVLRDGQVAGVFTAAEITPTQVIEAMAGEAGARAITAEVEAARPAAGWEAPTPSAQELQETPTLEVRGLSRRPHFEDVSFSVRAGEILGLAGLVGAGRSEIVRAIAGVDRPKAGLILLDGQPVRFSSPAEAIARGVVLLPEDRQTQGLVPQLGVRANVSLSILRRLLRALGLLNVGQEKVLAEDFIARLAIHCASPDQPVAELSGGNQQKVMAARTLACKPRVVLLDEPTRGVDVSAKADLHRLIRELADQGMAVVLVSSELQEVAALSDRIVVLREGRVVAEVPGAGATEKSLLALAAGQTEAA